MQRGACGRGVLVSLQRRQRPMLAWLCNLGRHPQSSGAPTSFKLQLWSSPSSCTGCKSESEVNEAAAHGSGWPLPCRVS